MPCQVKVPVAFGLAAVMPSPNAKAASLNNEVSTNRPPKRNIEAAIQDGRGSSPYSAERYSAANCRLCRGEQVLSDLSAFGDAGPARQIVEALIERPHGALDAQPVYPGDGLGHVRIL